MLESEYCFYLNTLKFCNVTKLLAYEIQTPFKRTKHGSLHISVTSVSNTRLFFSTRCCASPLPPFTLFTDYLTIRVLNKNEVRKWFEDYRSCRTCWTATKIFCEGGSNKKKVCISKSIYTALHLWLQSMLNEFTASPPFHPLRKNYGNTNVSEEGDVAILIHLSLSNYSSGTLRIDVSLSSLKLDLDSSYKNWHLQRKISVSVKHLSEFLFFFMSACI